jgi:ribose transport system substrate-binding protein
VVADHQGGEYQRGVNRHTTPQIGDTMLEAEHALETRTDKARIAVFTKNMTNQNLQAFRLGANRVAAQCGASISHRVPVKPDDAAQQVELLATVLAERPDVILLGPAEDKALEPIVERINDAQIPIVNFASRMTAGKFVSYVGADDVKMGFLAGHYLLSRTRDGGAVVIIEGPQTTSTGRDRARGFKKALAEFPGIRLLASVEGKYHERDAFEAMSKVMNEFGQIDAVLCANDSMAMGVLDALDRVGRSALVVGINATIQAARAIEQKRLLASVDYNGFTMGCIATEVAVRTMRGLTVPSQILMPTTVVSRSNVAGWLDPVEQRPCPAWEQVIRVDGGGG